MKRKRVYWFCLVFALQTAGTRLWPGEPAATSASAPVVWTLDGIASVGGYKPEVLGAPQITDEALGGRALRFNGWSDGLILPVNPLAGRAAFTIEVLFLPEVNGPSAQRFMQIEDDTGSRIMMETRLHGGTSWSLDTYLHCDKSNDNCPLLDRTKLHPTGRWAWVALTYDGRIMAHYINGVKELDGEVVFTPMTDGQTSLGVRLNQIFWFKGCIKEVRFHSTALGAEALQRLPE